MPKPETDLVLAPKTAFLRVELEPAVNALNSLFMVGQVQVLSGLGDWVVQTAEALGPERWHTHRVVFEGLYHALIPQKSHPSFEAYLEDLAATEAGLLRDRILNAYQCHSEIHGRAELAAPPDWEAVLQAPDSFLDYICDCFGSEHLDLEIEREAYAFLVDPVSLKELIVNHLKSMWDEFMAPEWRRILPTLEESAAAFRRLDFSSMSLAEAAQVITRREMEEKIELYMQDAEEVIFVPSTHVGPYIGKYKGNGTLWLVFGARMPDGVRTTSEALRRSDLLVRLTALADDTRLRILTLIGEQGELCSQELIDLLGVSQSSISRHLRQLNASGYIVERRTEQGKCFSLNPDRVQETLLALEDFFKSA